MARRSDTRDRMLQSGVLLFRERGVHATAFADVLERSGAPRGSVYHHFPGGREEFIVDVTDRAGTFMTGVLEQLIDEHEPLEAIRGFGAMWSGVLTGSDFEAGCPIVAAAVDGIESQQARAMAGDIFARWQTMIAAKCRQHEVAEERSQAFATLTVAAFEGAVVLCRAQRSLEPLQSVTDQLCVAAQAMLRGD